MHQDRRQLHFLYLLLDILFITLSFYIPYTIRYNSGLVLTNIVGFREYSLVFILWAVALIFILHNYRLYSTDRSLTIPVEILKVTKAVAFSSIIAALAIFGLKLEIFSRFIFIATAILLILTLSSWRTVKRLLIRRLVLKGGLSLNVLIVGAGKAAVSLLEEIQNNPYFGLKIIGFLDDYKSADVSGFPILGKINDLKNIVQRKFIDEIYVTIPSQRERVSQVLLQAEELGRTVRVVADNFNSLYFGKIGIKYIGFVPLVSYHEQGLHGSENFIKRLLDILISGIGLILLLPLFIVIALLIKIDSPGPVFYIAKRCGKKGRVFNFYKFRSMIKDADMQKEALRHKSDVKGPVFKIKDDPRITRIGKILRRYSLDELPQLFNVFKGDMSLVGPRPPTPDEVEKYDFWQMRRLSIRPGLTCLWQVRGRSDLSFYKWMKWDLWYIDNWSLGLDFMILFWTVPAVFKKEGAY